MSSQSIPSRKRPCPGTPPTMHPQMVPPLPPFPNAGSQLSNDQFLQWSQDPSTSVVNSPSLPETTGSYTPVSISFSTEVATMTAPLSTTQLTRRPMSQLVTRNHGYESSPSLVDHGSAPASDGWEESLAELEQRALIAKKEAQAKRKQIPPFVQKLRSFLDESKNTELIRWSDDGNSFIVLDEEEFAKKLIPELFKHNNYASFVRQLNMYGFHKKVGLSDNSMRASERKNKSPSEYLNVFFKRGHPDLLWLIQKPKNAPGQGSKVSGKGSTRAKTEDGEENEGDEYADDGSGRDDRPRPHGQLSLAGLPKEQLAGVYRELQAIRQQQQIISSTISKLRREHEQLYVQAASFQEQHTRHENSINAILKFLASFYDLRLPGHERGQNLPTPFSGAISEDVDDVDEYSLGAFGSELNRRFKKQPLLLKAPPTQPSDASGQTNTLSPAGTTPYDRSQSRRTNALMSPTPPPPAHNYSARLASTREAINSLAKMQAEQDRSVQNLANLLQPLSPTGTIPGIPGDVTIQPPALELDQFFNSGDYFTDIPDLDKTGSAFDFSNATTTASNQVDHLTRAPEPKDVANDLFEFDNIDPGPDGDLFGDPTSLSSPRGPPAFLTGYDDLGKAPGMGLHGNPAGLGVGMDTGMPGRRSTNNSQDNDLGRVVETFTDSEAASPPNMIDETGRDSSGQHGSRNGVKRRKKG